MRPGVTLGGADTPEHFSTLPVTAEGFFHLQWARWHWALGAAVGQGRCPPPWVCGSAC